MTFSTTTRAMPDFDKENTKDEFVPRPIVRKSLAPRAQQHRTKLEEIGTVLEHYIYSMTRIEYKTDE